ncbi:MAG: DUF3465 domain-containing protein, partial [Candidatus Sericytochromatia bacterium]|nr:DUF3465 domain-containing protein [Candidatus Sericytochromatia bacterium]
TQQPLNNDVQQQTNTPSQQSLSASAYLKKLTGSKLTGNQPPQKAINAVFQGVVTQKFPDDNDGLKHELFSFKLTDGLAGKYNGQVVKVAHDISYAPYVPIEIGTKLEIKGDFLPDATPTKVLHWSHKSDNPNHPSGYIKDLTTGKVYE